VEIFDAMPARPDHLKLAHSPGYVDGVLTGTEDNGFGNRDRKVASSLLWTTGALMTAAMNVVAGKKHAVACAPVSGFHRAHYASASGFCTFNGLVVTAMQLKRLGLAKRIGILDFDYHFGDGTDEIIERLGLTYINHYTAGRKYSRLDQAKAFLSDVSDLTKDVAFKVNEVVDESGESTLGAERVDILLYQAGADAHIHDPLGGFLTTEQMRERDRKVFRTCRMYGIRVVWVLAGGYQRDPSGSIAPVIELYRNTMQACIDVFNAELL
jgi:acetoin utilization deacetylase AcuC-like enzyme